MKKKSLILGFLFISFMAFGQTSVKGINVSGVTGVITTPSARIGWEKSDFGLDLTYSMIVNHGSSYIPAGTLSLFKKAEISFAYDWENDQLSNILLGSKFQFYKKKGSSLAIGGEWQNALKPNATNLNSFDIYLVNTYEGRFFNLPAVTSMMLGWQIMDRETYTSDFNFSMGFEMSLFPETFKDYLFFISDFGNYTYSETGGRIGVNRGVYNAGIRFDPIKANKYKFVINLVGTDLLDDGGRGFLFNATFGFGF